MIRAELAGLKRELSLMVDDIQEIAVEIPRLRGKLLREQYDSCRRIILNFETKILGCNALSKQEFPIAKDYFDICDNLRKKIKEGYLEASSK